MTKTLGAVLQWPFRHRQSLAMKERVASNLAGFIERFPGSEIEAEAVWKALRSVAVVDGFAPDPGDSLLWMYGLADEDLDEVMEDVLCQLECRLPTPDETRGEKPVDTVEDAVAFLRVWRSRLADRRPDFPCGQEP